MQFNSSAYDDREPEVFLTHFNCAVKMSLTYGFGGATAALGVVGACKFNDAPRYRGSRIDVRIDMLFTGDGEAFNVCSRKREGVCTG